MVYEPVYHDYKYFKCTRSFWRYFYLYFILVFYILGAFLLKQLFYSCSVGNEMIISNSALRDSMATYHLISNVRTLPYAPPWPSTITYISMQRATRGTTVNYPLKITVYSLMKKGMKFITLL